MSLAIITLLPMLAGFGLLYWANQLDEEHDLLILLFQLLFLPLILLSIHLGVIDATILYGANADLVAQLAMFAYYTGWVIFLVGAYWCFMVLKKIYDLILQKKAQKKEDKYGD